MAKIEFIPQGSVTTPIGFTASGMYCGIKKNQRKYDVALLVSDRPAVFTLRTNSDAL